MNKKQDCLNYQRDILKIIGIDDSNKIIKCVITVTPGIGGSVIAETIRRDSEYPDGAIIEKHELSILNEDLVKRLIFFNFISK